MNTHCRWFAVLPLTLVCAALARGDDLSDLKQQLQEAQQSIRAMQQKIEALEAKQQAAAAAPAALNGAPVTPLPNAVAAAPMPTPTPPKPASAAKFEVYGFAQVDYVQDFKRVNPDWEDTLRASRIPTHAGQFGTDGQSILSVRQSRLGVQGSLPMAGDTLNTRFEFDMFGVGSDQGQTTIRLRHAYGEWHSILAGQTNSLFMDGDVFPNIIDYWGPGGMVFLRNPQIRWTPLRGDTTFAVAIEKPGNDIDPGDLRTVDASLDSIRGDEKTPDLTAQLRVQDTWGHVQLAGILRRLGYETIGTDNNRPKGHETGWGLDLTSNFKFGDDKLILGAVYGHGIANYMNDGGVDLAADGDLSDLDAKAVPLLGAIAYYDHFWNREWSTSLGYSVTRVDNQDRQSADAFEKGEYASINLLYSPTQRVMMGAEYLWGQRTDNDGSDGYDSRLQFSVKYGFSSLDFQ